MEKFLTLKDELETMGRFISKLEQEIPGLEKHFVEMKNILIEKANHVTKKLQAYHKISPTIKEIEGAKEENARKYDALRILEMEAKVEKYTTCKIIRDIVNENSNDLSYYGEHYFLVKSLHFFVGILDDGVVFIKC